MQIIYTKYTTYNLISLFNPFKNIVQKLIGVHKFADLFLNYLDCSVVNRHNKGTIVKRILYA